MSESPRKFTPRIRARIMLALVTTLASALVLMTVQGASAASEPPTKTLPGEGSWMATGIHSQDTITVADDTTTDSTIAMWRSNTPGDNSLAWQVNQDGHPYDIQGANAQSENAPYLIANNGFFIAFHRGLQNQIWYAFGSLATPTRGSNFHISSWFQIPGVTTSSTPVATLVGGNVWVAYRGETNNNIYTAHAGLSVGGTVVPTAWRNDGSLAANTLNSPALTTLEGRPVLVYNRGGQLYRRISSGIPGTWGAETRITTGIPNVVGRPSVMAAGNALDVVSLGGARHSDGGFSLYRNAYWQNILGQLNSVTGWTVDPSRYASASAPYLYAEITAVALIVNMVIRGLNNGQMQAKQLSYNSSR
jgi:hypothetical protein